MEYRFTLTDNSDTEVLTIDPKGWDNLSILLDRDPVYHGVFKSYTFSLDFICADGGGYDFINSRYEERGPATDVIIFIDIRCQGGNWTRLFEGLADLNSITRTDKLLSVRFDQYNAQKKVMDRIDTPVDMEATRSIDGSSLNNYTYSGYDINMHSRRILLTADVGYDSGATIPDKETINELDNVQTYGYWLTHSLPVLDGTYKTINGNIEQIDLRSGGAYTFQNADLQPLFTMTDEIAPETDTFDVNYDFAGTFIDYIDPIAPTRSWGNIVLNLCWGSSLSDAGNNGKFQTLVTIASDATTLSTYSTPFSGSGTQSVTLSKGDSVWLLWGVTGGGYTITTGPFLGDVKWLWQYTSANINWQSTTETDATTAKSWAIHEACSRVCESLSNQTDVAFYSELFGRQTSQPITYTEDGCGSYLAVTNGLKIRQIDKPIYLTLSDLFKSLNALWGIGMGFETVNGNTVVKFERKDYFYDADTVMLTLDDVNNIEMTIANELYYNEAEIGYEKWESEETGGLDECNTNHVYALPEVRRKLRYSTQSPYITSSYAIELTRRRLSRVNGATKDFKYDNDKFLIELNRSDLTQGSKDTNFNSITGIFESDSIYNYEHSPARMLLRHINVLNGGIFRRAAASVQFQSGEGNISNTGKMIIDCPGSYFGQGVSSQSLIEDQDFGLNDDNIIDPTPLWTPELYTFEYPLSLEQYLTIQNTQRGVIRFTDDGVNYKKGYIVTLEYFPESKNSTFQLLRAYEENP